MKIYLEFIFIINYLLDFMILYGTKRLLKINKSLVRVFIGSFIGSLTTFILFISIDNFSLFIIKVIVSVLMIFVSFGYNNFFRNTLYFYLISIILGGVMYLFDLESNYYFCILFLVIGCPITIYLFVKELMTYKEKYKNKYIVEIQYKNKSYKLEGFIDTGNRLTSPIKRESVILVNLNINSKEVIYVPYKALNTTGVIPCIRPDRVLIDDVEFNNCLIGLSRDKFSLNGLNCILPNIFKEKLC